MKFDAKGIRFNIWLYFCVFAAAILLLFGILLNALIRPYYRNDRMERMDVLSAAFESNLFRSGSDERSLNNLYSLLINSNVCAYVYNENGEEIYSADSLGESCAFNRSIELNDFTMSLKNDPISSIDYLKKEGALKSTFSSQINNDEMLLYGKTIRRDLINYYLFINSPLEPVESVLTFIFSQYIYITFIILIFAFIASFYVAKKISHPIVNMKNETKKLAEQNYDLNLPQNSYTEINELSSALDEASLRLGKVDELRKDLVANVSHDIKTPLTMIQAYAEMIQDISGDDPVKRNEHIDVILKETKYLNRLVTDMQELSKMQSGNIELHKSNFDLKETVEDVDDLLMHLCTEKKIELISECVPVIIYADEVKMAQVVYNFILNAIKHSPENTTVTVRILDNEDYVRLEVEDHGSGISEEELPYIWDRYYKIDKGFQRNLTSSGLGLAIVRVILELHHARYGVQSKVGEGSLFYFEMDKDYENE